jgi:hypothetical protein
MSDIPDEYELNEKDIDSMVEYLRIFDPEHATPQRSIDFLEYLRVAVHEYAHSNPDKLEELYRKFSANQ